MRRFEILLTDVAALLGSGCSDVQVVWEKSSCGDINCFKNDSKTHLVVEVPDGCTQKCFRAKVTCLTKCEGKKSAVLDICPCTTSTDCKACETCGPNGYCISVCPDGKFCGDDGCIECDDANPCPGDKICVQGVCQCPPDKPYMVGDQCFSCLPDSCPPGQKCTPDGCVPEECPAGLIMDPVDGKCKNCVTDFNCPDGKVCVNGNCECPPGFYEDPITGNCVERGCSSDEDCPDCETCDVTNGVCMPKQCPAGFFLHPDTCKCVKECDCDSPICDSDHTKACLPTSIGKCYCSDCNVENPTSQADCCEGFYFNPTTMSCEPNPCLGGCENGAECGPGCGCGPEKICIPCDSRDCNNCPEVKGCDCTDGQKCKDCPDGIYTSNAADCPTGYGLYNGQCVCCSNFKCTECNNIPGCECTNGQDCVGKDKDCKDEFEGSKKDCADGCELETTLDLQENCACPVITVNTNFVRIIDSSSDYNVKLLVELRKGVGTESNYTGLPRLDDVTNRLIADNETATYGSVSAIVLVEYNVLDLNGNVTSSGSEQPVVYDSVSISGVGFVNLDNVLLPNIGKVYGDKVVTNVTLTINKDNAWKFPSDCTHDGFSIISKYTYSSNDMLEAIKGTVTDANPLLPKVSQVKSSSSRYPLFTYWKSADAIYTDDEIFRKEYIKPTEVGGKEFVDNLFGPNNWPDGASFPLDKVNAEGLLVSNRWYKVDNDCGCIDEKSFDYGKVFFCSPCAVSGEVVNCGRALRIDGPFAPCSVNQDLKQFKDEDGNNYTGLEDFQVKWELYINNDLVATFKHEAGSMIDVSTGSPMFATYELPSNDIITSAYLKHIHDDNGECNLTFDIAFTEATIKDEIECGSGSNYQVTVPIIQGQETITGVSPVGIATVVGSSYVLSLVKGNAMEITYSLSNGCQVVKTYNEACCDQFSVTVSNSAGGCGSDYDLEASISGGSGAYDYNWMNAAGTTVGSESSYLGVADSSEEYKVLVTDTATGCIGSATAVVGTKTTPEVTIDYKASVCGLETSTAILTVNPSGNGSIDYTLSVDGGSFSSGTLSIINGVSQPLVGIQGGSTVVFNNLVTGGCPFDYERTITVTKGEEGVLNVTPSPSSICKGESVDVVVTGPVGTEFILSVSGSNTGAHNAVTIPSMGSVTLTDTTTANSGVNVYTATAQVATGGCVVSSGSANVAVGSCNCPPYDIKLQYQIDGSVLADYPNDGSLTLQAVEGAVIKLVASVDPVNGTNCTFAWTGVPVTLPGTTVNGNEIIMSALPTGGSVVAVQSSCDVVGLGKCSSDVVAVTIAIGELTPCFEETIALGNVRVIGKNSQELSTTEFVEVNGEDIPVYRCPEAYDGEFKLQSDTSYAGKVDFTWYVLNGTLETPVIVGSDELLDAKINVFNDLFNNPSVSVNNDAVSGSRYVDLCVKVSPAVPECDDNPQVICQRIYSCCDGIGVDEVRFKEDVSGGGDHNWRFYSNPDDVKTYNLTDLGVCDDGILYGWLESSFDSIIPKGSGFTVGSLGNVTVSPNFYVVPEETGNTDNPIGAMTYSFSNLSDGSISTVTLLICGETFQCKFRHNCNAPVDPPIVITMNNILDCFADAIIATVSGGFPGYTYKWIVDGDVDTPIITTDLDVTGFVAGQSYTVSLEVTDSQGNVQTSETFTFVRGICTASNVIFFVDVSGSMDSDISVVEQLVIDTSASLYSKDSGYKFSVVTYTSTDSVPVSGAPVLDGSGNVIGYPNMAMTIKNNGQNSAIATASYPVSGASNLQAAINWLVDTGIGGAALTIDPLMSTKVVIISDEAASTSTARIGNYISTDQNTLPLDADKTDGNLSVEHMIYQESDALKNLGAEVIVVRYPAGVGNQLWTDEHLEAVASPNKFYAHEFADADVVSDILSGLDCEC